MPKKKNLPPPIQIVVRTPEDIDTWLASAIAGERVVYFIGYLNWKETPEYVCGVGEHAWMLHKSNLVTLTQVQLEPDLYAYYMVKNKRGTGVQLRETNHKGELVVA